MAHSKTQSPTGFYCFHIPPPLCAISAISFWLASQSTSRPQSPSATLPCCIRHLKQMFWVKSPLNTSIMNEICFHCKERIHSAAGIHQLTRQSTIVSLPSACVITLSWNWGCHIWNSITVHFQWDNQNHQQNPDDDGHLKSATPNIVIFNFTSVSIFSCFPSISSPSWRMKTDAAAKCQLTLVAPSTVTGRSFLWIYLGQFWNLDNRPNPLELKALSMP